MKALSLVMAMLFGLALVGCSDDKGGKEEASSMAPASNTYNPNKDSDGDC